MAQYSFAGGFVLQTNVTFSNYTVDRVFINALDVSATGVSGLLGLGPVSISLHLERMTAALSLPSSPPPVLLSSRLRPLSSQLGSSAFCGLTVLENVSALSTRGGGEVPRESRIVFQRSLPSTSTSGLGLGLTGIHDVRAMRELLCRHRRVCVLRSAGASRFSCVFGSIRLGSSFFVRLLPPLPRRPSVQLSLLRYHRRITSSRSSLPEERVVPSASIAPCSILYPLV
ncbi:hypothetical protein SCP_1501530 [Sparassis crispa]|uniref:Uncharacterized protein n=1 Tax=Sparassis crispa TaxID=139825 RepID=A0A401H3Y6_9APHY|nr:hypothetical protein SCP_1501530 [Sparassis crispa]GBE89147.1 hypothetical protein SCP_1501530 [Sparassis crispa]